MLEKFIKIKDRIKQVYQTYSQSMMIGYSGGKDSTLVLDLTLEALEELYNDSPLNIVKTTYIISSNTLIENPFVTTLISNTEKKISALFKHLNIKFINVVPKQNETFWVSIIGKGYPLPLNRFRWCTRQLKIEPMNVVMDEINFKNKEVISVLGIRKDESSSRKRKMEDNNENQFEDDFYRNIDNTKGYIFAPIHDVNTDELWKYAFKRRKTMWKFDYGILFEMYWETSKECPMALEASLFDDNQIKCGTSRWGCWMCPLSNTIWIDNMVENGLSEFRPLANFRRWMIDTRDLRKNRYLGSHLLSSKDPNKISIRRKGYTKFKKKETSNNTIFYRPKKEKRKKIEVHFINNILDYSSEKDTIIYDKENYEMISNSTSFLFNEEGATNNEFVKMDNDLFLPAVGPYTLEYRFVVLKKLISLYDELDFEKLRLINVNQIDIISNFEIKLIFAYWRKIAAKLGKSDYIEKNIKEVNKMLNRKEYARGKKEDKRFSKTA